MPPLTTYLRIFWLFVANRPAHVVWLTTFLALLVPGAAIATEKLPGIADVRLGFADSYKVGEWVPVAITLQGASEAVRGSLELTTLDGDGVPARLFWEQGPTIEVPAEQTTSVRTIVKFGRRRSPLTVTFVTGDGRRVSRVFPPADLPEATPAAQTMIVALGDDLDLAKVLGRRHRGADEVCLAGPIDDPQDLPEEWLGYAGVDTVTMTTAASDLCDRMSEAQIAALDQWVLLGGRLILTIGSRGEELLGSGGRWNRFAPGRFVHVTSLRDTTALESAVKAGRLDAPAAGGTHEVPVTVLSEVAGRIDLEERPGRPLIVRSARGLGQVVFVCLDLDGPPLAGWDGRPQLVDQLLTRPGQSSQAAGPRQSGRVAHVGYTDLIGQLRAALDQFRGVRVIPFSVIGGLVVLYIALIGPLDYLLLRRLGRRMEWTWLTFSLIAFVFCAAAWGLARWSQGRELRVNQLAVVDVDAQQGIVRGTAWAHVYTPRADLMDMELGWDPGGDVRAPGNGIRPTEPTRGRNHDPVAGQGGGTANRGEMLSWFGLPGNALGGMDSVARTQLLPTTYELQAACTPQTGLRLSVSQMPLSQASSRSLVGRWWGTGPVQPQPRLSASAAGTLRGELINPLPIDLTDCTLLYGRWAYALAAVRAGQRVPFEATLTPRNLETLLQQRRIEGMKDVTTPWDKSDPRVPRIAQLLMFHEAAGGQGYTGLTHRYHRPIDLSDQLQLGRAVLVGRAAHRGVRLNLNGRAVADNEANRHWTFYRIVFPVTRDAAE